MGEEMKDRRTDMVAEAKPRPRIFVSAVTAEFGTARNRVADVLNFLGFDVEKQEIFGTESGDLRQVLRDKIDGCDGLVQIIGSGYGAEPPLVDGGFGRVSYTQFEYLHAVARGKKTWLLFAGDGAVRDAVPEELDLPRGGKDADAREYQAERRALQEAYVAARKSDGHVRWNFHSETELENAVLKLRNDSDELRREFRQWQTDVLSRVVGLGERIEDGQVRSRRMFMAALAAVVVVGAAGFWWMRSFPVSSAGFEYVTSHDGAGAELMTAPDIRKMLANVFNPPGGRLVNGTGVRILGTRSVPAAGVGELVWLEIEVLDGPAKGRRGWTLQKNVKKSGR